jgi:hypothetical protein
MGNGLQGHKTMPLSLIRQVQGRCGSVRLYKHHRFGLAQVVTIDPAAGMAPVIEVQRHRQESLETLLFYLDEVQNALRVRGAAEKLAVAKPRRPGSMWKPMRAECSRAAQSTSKSKATSGS